MARRVVLAIANLGSLIQTICHEVQNRNRGPRSVKAAGFLILLLLVAGFATTVPAVQADDEGADDPALISIDVENGASAHDIITFSGIVEDETMPNRVYWRVSKNGSQFDGGDLKPLLTAISSTSSRPQWSWSFDLEISATGGCYCYVTVYAEESSGAVNLETRMVYMIPQGVAYPASGFLIYGPEAGSWATGIIQVNGWAASSTPSFMVVDKQITPSFFEPSILPETVEDCQPTTSIAENRNGDFTLDIDVSGWLDGWYRVDILLCDDVLLGGVNLMHSLSLRINNAAPIVKLDGIKYAMESDEWHIFDATETEDPYWGKGDLYYVWTLRRPSQTGSVPMDVQMGVDIRSYAVSASLSGNYTLSLTVYDEGGLSSTKVVHFDIQNEVPTVSLMIDGVIVEAGQSVKLLDAQNTLIDGTGSHDSVNDVGRLRCVWSFDGTLMYEGCQRTFSWPDDSTYRAMLTLEIIDDDGDSSTIMVELVHPDEVRPFPVAILLLVFSLLFLTYAVVHRMRADDELNIPKWKAE